MYDSGQSDDYYEEELNDFMHDASKTLLTSKTNLDTAIEMRHMGGDRSRRADSMMSTDTYRMDGDLRVSHKSLKEYLEVKKGRSTSTLLRK